MIIIRWIIAEDKYQIISTEGIILNNKKIIFVGIIEESMSTINCIKKMLINFEYQLNYSNSMGNIMILNKDNINLIVTSMKPMEAAEVESFGVEFDFLIINIIDSKLVKDAFLKTIFKHCDYYIINTDEDNLNILSIESLNGIIITYGFNSKTTMTISSYIIEQNMEASLCLQREIITLFGDRIDSFEFIVEINSANKDHVYSVLAASILCLVIGEKIQLDKTIII